VLWAVAGRMLPDGRRGAIAFGVVLVAIQVADLTMLHYRVPGRRFRYADIRRSEAALHPRMEQLRNETGRSGERILATDGSRNQFLLPNLTRAWGVRAASGTGSLPLSRYIEMLAMSSSGTVDRQAFSPAHRGVDLFAVRYVLAPQDSALSNAIAQQTDRWQTVDNLHYYEDDPDTHYTLFRNLHNLPHAWCVQRTVQVGASDAAAAIHGEPLRDGSQFDPAQVALYEEDALRDWQSAGGATAGHAIVSRLDQRRYLVNTDAACLLVISEVYYPWWHATVDARVSPPVRVNYAMVGVRVPPGEHVIRLSMRPVSVWLGGAISGAGVLFWFGLLVPRRRGRTSDVTPTAA